MIENMSPSAFVSLEHPLLRLELQRIRWLKKNFSARRGTIKTAMIVAFILVGLWLWSIYGGMPIVMTSQLFSNRSGPILGMMLLASIGASVFLDFACLIVTVNSFASDVTAGRWDLLRLTNIPEGMLVAAKHTTAQLRAWRLMIAIVTSRVIVTILGAITLLSNIQEFIFRNGEYLFIVILAVFAVFYIIEPYWRLKGVTALGLAISSRVRNLVSISLSAIAAVFLIWMSEAIIMGFIFWVLSLFLRTDFDTYSGYCVVLFFCLITGGVIYGYYRLMVSKSLNYVMRRMDSMLA